MPIPTAFHSRTAPLNENQEWRTWSGYLAAALYEPLHEREYYAIRNSAALIDVSPLFKYEISGPGAEQLANRLVTRDVLRCAEGQIFYTPWCDDDGKVIDDGTLWRLGTQRFRLTAADPNLAWLQDAGCGLQADVQDVSEQLAALALQGPSARLILQQCLQEIDLERLNYYRFTSARAGLIPLTVSRTGYTGDLGYELWVEPQHAGALWDILMQAGKPYGIVPAGMLALDIARIEAGLVMIQVDYISTRAALIEAQKSSPFEIGLGWAVDFRKPNFIGRKALLEEQQRGSQWMLAGVEVDWVSMENVYRRFGLTPQVAGRASRAAVPIYINERQVGQMTSHTFSPILKRYIGLATVERALVQVGERIDVEVTVEYTRQKVEARLVRPPFYDPPRKRA